MQAELGLPPTPVEVAVPEWFAEDASIDFADAGMRGPARSRVARESARKAAPAPSSAVGRGDDPADWPVPDAPRRGRRWALVGGLAIAAVASAAAAWALLTGWAL